MLIWLGIGEHEVQIETQGPKVLVRLPKPCALQECGETLVPVTEDDDEFEYDIGPTSNPFESGNGGHSWYFLATYLRRHPHSGVLTLSETGIALCRPEEQVWGLCLYPNHPFHTAMSLPSEASTSLEMAFRKLQNPFRLIQGGLAGK